jgi:hypothetical protein
MLGSAVFSKTVPGVQHFTRPCSHISDISRLKLLPLIRVHPLAAPYAVPSSALKNSSRSFFAPFADKIPWLLCVFPADTAFVKISEIRVSPFPAFPYPRSPVFNPWQKMPGSSSEKIPLEPFQKFCGHVERGFLAFGKA